MQKLQMGAASHRLYMLANTENHCRSLSQPPAVREKLSKIKESCQGEGEEGERIPEAVFFS